MREKKNTSFYSKTKEKREKREREHQKNWLTDLCQNPPTIFHKQNPSALGLSQLITAQNHFFFSTMECFVYSVDARNILKMTLVFSNYISSGYTLPHQRQGML